MNCWDCNRQMEKGFLYVRGFGASLLWSDRPDTSAVSRRGMDQIDLSKVSVNPSRQQAVVLGYRCPDCGEIRFKTTRNPKPTTHPDQELGGAGMEATDTR